MTLEGPDGKRHLIDRDGRLIDQGYDGPAVGVVDGQRVLVREQLDPASGRIVDALVELGKARRETDT